MYHGCVPGVSSMQVVLDGVPKLFINSIVPLRAGMRRCTCSFYFVFFHDGDAFCSLFSDYGLDFREISY